MVLQLLAAAACIVAVFLQMALHRSPDIPDSRSSRYGRRIMMATMVVASLGLVDAALSGKVYPVLSIVAGLTALGQIMFAWDSLETLLERNQDGHHA
jgi:hypothetical protein